MPHSYEELRMAAFDVPSGRIHAAYDPSQYRHLAISVVEAIDRNATHQAIFAPVAKERTILQKVNKFKHILEQRAKTLPSDLKEDLDTNFLGILSIIRNFRNQSGHPSGKIIDREQAYILLQLFPHYCKKMYQLIDHYT